MYYADNKNVRYELTGEGWRRIHGLGSDTLSILCAGDADRSERHVGSRADCAVCAMVPVVSHTRDLHAQMVQRTCAKLREQRSPSVLVQGAGRPDNDVSDPPQDVVRTAGSRTDMEIAECNS